MEGRLCRPARTGNCAVTRIFAQNLSHAAQNRNNGGSAGGCGCAMFRRGRPCTRKVIRYAYANRRHARRRGRAGAHTQASILEYKFFPTPPPPPPPASRTKLPQIADIQTVTHYHGHTGCVRPYTSSPMLSTLCALAWWTCSARQRGTVAEWTSAPESSAGLFFSCRCEQRANIF